MVMTNDKWFNEMDGEQAFPSVVIVEPRRFELLTSSVQRRPLLALCSRLRIARKMDGFIY